MANIVCAALARAAAAQPTHITIHARVNVIGSRNLVCAGAGEVGNRGSAEAMAAGRKRRAESVSFVLFLLGWIFCWVGV